MAATVAAKTALGQEWIDVISTDAAVQTKHLLAPELVIETLLTDASAAATEAARVQTLRGVRRDRFSIVAEYNAANAALDLGDVVTVQHARYGLSGGKKFYVIGIDPDVARRLVTFTLWG